MMHFIVGRGGSTWASWWCPAGVLQAGRSSLDANALSTTLPSSPYPPLAGMAVNGFLERMLHCGKPAHVSIPRKLGLQQRAVGTTWSSGDGGMGNRAMSMALRPGAGEATGSGTASVPVCVCLGLRWAPQPQGELGRVRRWISAPGQRIALLWVVSPLGRIGP